MFWDWQFTWEILPLLAQASIITVEATILGLLIAAVFGLFFAQLFSLLSAYCEPLRRLGEEVAKRRVSQLPL